MLKMKARCDQCGGWGAHHPSCPRGDEPGFFEDSPNAYSKWLNESFDLSPMEPVGGIQMEMEEWRSDEASFGQLMPELSPQNGRWWQGGAWANLYVPMPDLGEPEREMCPPVEPHSEATGFKDLTVEPHSAATVFEDRPVEPHSAATGLKSHPVEPHSAATGPQREVMATLGLAPVTRMEPLDLDSLEPYSPSQVTECGEWFVPEEGGYLRSAWDSPASPTESTDSSNLYCSDPASDEATEEAGACGGRRDSLEDLPFDWASVGVPNVRIIPTARVHPMVGRPVDPRLRENRPVVMVNVVTARLTMPGGTSYEETSRMVPSGGTNRATQTIVVSDSEDSDDE
jgi:hypothetical protein